MLSAAHEAGFAVAELLPEPVAAAFSAPSGAAFEAGQLVLVYDFGGGTFDAALVRIGAEDHEIVDGRGLPFCGGFDIDVAVAGYLCDANDELRQLYESGDRGRVVVLDLAERLKKEVSESTEALQEVMGIEVALTRAEFESVAAKTVAETIACCRQLLDDTGHGDQDLDAVFVAGGSSRMPIVAAMLAAEFDAALRIARDPEVAVVRGAALWASRGDTRSSPSIALPPDEVPLRWEVPGGFGTLVGWDIEPGSVFEIDGMLARVRLPDGRLLRLTAADAGAVRALHVFPGETVRSGQWLLTARRTVYPAWSHGYPVSPKRSAVITCALGNLYVAMNNWCYAYDIVSGTLRWASTYTSYSYRPLSVTAEDGVVTISFTQYSGPGTCRLDAATGQAL